MECPVQIANAELVEPLETRARSTWLASGMVIRSRS